MSTPKPALRHRPHLHPLGKPPAAPLLLAAAAEAAGTFVLVFGVIGAATFSASFAKSDIAVNVGFLGVAFALGLSVLVGAIAWGPVSGGHFNPAVTLGLAAAGFFSWRRVPVYIAAQIVGGLAASTALVLVAAGTGPAFLADAREGGFASTGWGPLSPSGASWEASFLIETVTTAVLMAVVLAVSTRRTDATLAPLAIGFTLTVVALVAIPISNGSFNPARSIATAIYGGPVALEQLWLSLAAPALGAVFVGLAVTAVRRLAPRARRSSYV
ncbi:aquaporin [Microbacterium sp. LS_15]|uniref:aquaporin n=1 Tax=Microbacterium sp. LS_15 TaxID=3055790 RepID=UPI0035BFF09F